MIGGHFLISYPCTVMIISLCWNILKNMLVIVYDDVRITKSSCIYIRCVIDPYLFCLINVVMHRAKTDNVIRGFVCCNNLENSLTAVLYIHTILWSFHYEKNSHDQLFN